MLSWLTGWSGLLRVWLYGLGVCLTVGALSLAVVFVTRYVPEVVIAWVLLLTVFGICVPLLMGLVVELVQEDDQRHG